MPLRFVPRTGVSLLHGSDVAATLRCVRSLELSDDLDLAITVVLRGADVTDRDDLEAGLRGRGSVVAVDAGAGAIEAHAAAVERMAADGVTFAWLLDPELVVDPWTLGRLVKHMGRVPDCAVVGILRTTTGRFGDRAGPAPAADVDAVDLAGSLFRCAAWQALGPLGPADEVDGLVPGWCDRARRAGWRVMVHRRAHVVLEAADA